MEEAGEDESGTGVGGPGEALTSEQVTAEAILDGERVAVDAVEGLELPLEVGGPDGVGRIEGRGGTTGMRGFASAPQLVD